MHIWDASTGAPIDIYSALCNRLLVALNVRVCYQYSMAVSYSLALRGQLSHTSDVYMKLAFGRIANFSSYLLIGPFYANLCHQICFS